jgi:Ca2+-binding RTX toxin-like protein
MEKIMSTFSIPAGQTSNQNIILDAIGESANIAGELITNNGQPSILTQNKFNAIEVETTGFVSSNTSAIQVQGFGTVIDNEGTIYGAVNGINIADDNSSSAVILNEGTISSASRGINIGGVGATVFNSGLITTTANPRNGTIYGDVTAQNVFIINQTNGIIDVGAGLNGDAISLELGANVNGTIRNEGLIQGRGVAGVANPINQAAAIHLYWVSASGAPVSIFNGDIINKGTLASENGAAIVIDDAVDFRGEIINSGIIQGGTVLGFHDLAIDAREAEGNIHVDNSGQIKGDVFLTAGDDIYYGRDGNIEGGVYGFDGDDLLVGGSSTEKLFGGTGNDILRGGAGDDLIDGGRGNDLLNGGADDDIFRFSSDILGDLQQDLDRINNFQSNDSFDFSDYLNAGGTISFIRGQRDLLVNLNNEDVLIVRGDLDAAEQQLLQIL